MQQENRIYPQGKVVGIMCVYLEACQLEGRYSLEEEKKSIHSGKAFELEVYSCAESFGEL